MPTAASCWLRTWNEGGWNSSPRAAAAARFSANSRRIKSRFVFSVLTISAGSCCRRGTGAPCGRTRCGTCCCVAVCAGAAGCVCIGAVPAPTASFFAAFALGVFLALAVFFAAASACCCAAICASVISAGGGRACAAICAVVTGCPGISTTGGACIPPICPTCICACLCAICACCSCACICAFVCALGSPIAKSRVRAGASTLAPPALRGRIVETRETLGSTKFSRVSFP